MPADLKDQNKEISKGERAFFFLSIALFLVAAVLGWVKLRYGFNFIDEGYHMTEGWRLAAGDNLFKDGLTDILLLYTLFNAMIFKMHPGITLLGFREIQFCLTMLAMLFFSASLYYSYRRYWYLPLIFSLFAFTGLDPMGMESNLSYYTYAHFFLIMYVSCTLWALFCPSAGRKAMFNLLAGAMLFCLSINALYLSVVAASPVLLYFLSRYGKSSLKYDFKDVCITLSPFVLSWVIFLAVFNKEYVTSVISFSQLMVKHHWSLTSINLEALGHMAVTGVFLLCLSLGFKKLKTTSFIIFSGAAALMMYAVIATSCFGLMTPYYEGWFAKPMWLSSLLVCFIAVFWASFIWKAVRKEELSPEDEICLVIMVPGTMQFLISSIVSTNGVLEILHSAIPLVAACTLATFTLGRKEPCAEIKRPAVLPMLLLPFYITTAWADWTFTYFDVLPWEADARIEQGFGKGIHTNREALKLYTWISTTASSHSKENDYILSYIVSPMVYMIAHRKPALDHSFTDFVSRPPEFFVRSVEKMQAKKREPRLAFVFEYFPAVLSIASLPDDRKAQAPPGAQYMWFGKHFNFSADDPISRYVLKNMYILDEYNITSKSTVRCFVDNPVDPLILKLSRAIEKSPGKAEMHNALGDLYAKKSDYDSALGAYHKSLSLDPGSVDTLGRIATAYAMTGRNGDSLRMFKKIIEIKPDNADAYYNLACVLHKEERDGEALQALDKALGLGFNDCGLLRGDKDLERIRDTALYKEILKERCSK